MAKKKKAKVVTNIPSKPVKEESTAESTTETIEDTTLPTSEARVFYREEPEPEPSDYMKWLNSAPEARGNLTRRWYGETFIPEYKAWLEQGKQFDK